MLTLNLSHDNETMDLLTFHLVVEMATACCYFCSTQMNLAHTKQTTTAIAFKIHDHHHCHRHRRHHHQFCSKQ